MSGLEKEFERRLPDILTLADSSYEEAISIIDSYLENSYDDMEFRKSLLSWKGLFYLENGRFHEAIDHLETADQLESRETLRNFNVKSNLAQAYFQNSAHEDACRVLIDSLDKFEEVPYLLKILVLLAEVIPHTNHPIYAQVENKLQQVKLYYGIKFEPSIPDLLTEIKIIGETIHQATVRYNRLDMAVRKASSPSEALNLLRDYLDSVSIEYFRMQAQKRLESISIS